MHDRPPGPAVTPGPGHERPPHLRPALLAAVALGGLLGTATRHGAALLLPPGGTGWPTATLVVNLAGALLLGLLLEALARSGPDAGWRRTLRLLAGTGFCGALTTYSALAVEIDLLADRQRWGLAVAYGLVSVAAGLAATVAGVALGRALRPRAGVPPRPGGPR